MTKEELDKFEKELEEKGYTKYTRKASFENYKYSWYKGIRKHNNVDEIPDCLIIYKVYDYSEYGERDPYIKRSPYSIEIEVYLDGTMKNCDYFRPTIRTNMTIDEVEKMVDSLIDWGGSYCGK